VINWKNAASERHLRGGSVKKRDADAPVLHPGYRPFEHAAFVEPRTKAQERLQKTRIDPYTGREFPQKPFVSYAPKKWKTIELGPELFGERS